MLAVGVQLAAPLAIRRCRDVGAVRRREMWLLVGRAGVKTARIGAQQHWQRHKQWAPHDKEALRVPKSLQNTKSCAAE